MKDDAQLEKAPSALPTTGATLVVIEHGKHVARIVPETESLEERLETLKASSTAPSSGRRLRAIELARCRPIQVY